MEIGISIVVPTCGRSGLLNRCIEALAVQALDPATYEIIVVDDGPSEKTRQLVTDWTVRCAARRLAVRYIANHGQHGPAAARNRGWHAARGEVIAFTDDDTVPASDWLKVGLAAFAGNIDAVWGRIRMPLSGSPTDYERDAQRLETAEFVTANCFCRKRVLEALGGFDERFRYAWREDSDFHFRLLDGGMRVAHVPLAVVVHPVRPAPWGVSLFQQKKILFDALLYKKHPRRYRQKIRATPRWDYYLLVASLLAALSGLIAGNETASLIGAAVWTYFTALFCLHRLTGTAKTPLRVAEIVLTSVLIPPLAVFWRMVGALRFRVAFI